MGKVLNSIVVTLVLIILAVLLWIVLDTAEFDDNQKLINNNDNDNQKIELSFETGVGSGKASVSELKTSDLSDALLNDKNSQKLQNNKEKNQKEKNQKESDIKECILNQTENFETELKPCPFIPALASKRHHHIQNLIIQMPFELIQSGKPLKEIDEFGEIIESTSHIQVEKIGISDLGDIYILSGYNYVFPASEYSYEQTIEYDEVWVEKGEHIQIYTDDTKKIHYSISGTREYYEQFDELKPNCPDIHDSRVIVARGEYSIDSQRCEQKEDLEKIGQEIVKFSDIELEKCINRSLGRSVNLKIKQYDLNQLVELKCISQKIRNLNGVSKIPNLKVLILNVENIGNLEEIKKLKSIEALLLRNGDSIDIEGLLDFDQLVYLKLEKIEVENLNMIGELINLKSLVLLKNNILDATFLEHAGAIENLVIKENVIDSFEYYPQLALKFLDLSLTNISNVEQIAQYSELEILRIQNARLVNIDALYGMPKLKVLKVEMNKISQANIFANGANKLNELYLVNNPIDCDYSLLKDLDFVSLDCR
ncbi:hypothetical protein [Marinicellulosiphila megalodicopiae]|uniref:hypothetical protein n=1 Tax=Marinicellulosiphila megalodicopiae TaxID=2724896 RepID=UPI003BB15285